MINDVYLTHSMTVRNLHSTCIHARESECVVNLPYPLKLMESVVQLYNNQLMIGLHGLKSNCLAGLLDLQIVSDLIATGFHPEQIVHSLTALLFHCQHCVPESSWDADVRKTVQDIIVEIVKHNADYSIGSR